MKIIKRFLPKFYFLLFTFYLFTSPLFSQTAFEPLHREVYGFLDRLSARGIIEYHDLITPVSRMTIAEKLRELSQMQDELTALEKQELAFLLQDFKFELDRLNTVEITDEDFSYLGKDVAGRWRALSYRDDHFAINFSPIYGVRYGQNDGKSQSHRWNGAYLYGYLGENWAFSFDFRDNREAGDNVDISKFFSPVTGIDADNRDVATGNAIEYSEVRTTLSYDWSWGRAVFGKDFINWGYAQNGKVVLSDKAPSFPFLRLDINPTHWLKFNYFHGWLESDVVDSTAIYPTLRENANSFGFREKFLASHTVTLTPKRGLDFSIGESIIYSDQLEVAYLMPLMFFRLADHYLSDRQNSAGSNAQLFFAASARNLIPKTHIYGELLIDDLSVANIFNAEKQINHLGGSVGAMITDLPVNNLSVRAEYSRINPFVYKHFIPTLLYTSSSYPLGHWLGHNADILFGEISYRFRRGISAKIWGQNIRKGGEGQVEDQYTLPHKPFLFGPVQKFTDWGASLRYEILHDLIAELKYESLQSQRIEITNGKTQNHISLAIFYGM